MISIFRSATMSYVNFYQHRLPSMLRQVRRIKRVSTSVKFYAVAVGRRVGIYRGWPSCKVQIDGIANAQFKRFDQHEDALRYLSEVKKEIPVPVQDFLVFEDSEPQNVVYIDGSCWRNGMPGAAGGIGIHWPGHPERQLSAQLAPGKQTNIRAELWAAITALRQAHSLSLSQLIIYTDSHFVIQCATAWLPVWKRNGWRTSAGAEVKNREDLQQLDEALGGVKAVIWKFVVAHSGVPGNEEADRLANAAIEKVAK